MNRRDLLKYVLAAPAVAAIPAALGAPMAVQTYYAPLLPGAWKCVNGHPYCNRCVTPVDLSEESLEQMCREIEARFGKTAQVMDGDFSIEALRYEHIWKPDTYICERCGVTEEDIEEGLATKFCRGSDEQLPQLFGFGEAP